MRRSLLFAVAVLAICSTSTVLAQYPGMPQQGAYPAATYPPGMYPPGMGNLQGGPPPSAFMGQPAGGSGEAGGPDAPPCCPWDNCKWSAFADFQYISVRNAEVPYGVRFLGPANVPPPGAFGGEPVIEQAPPGTTQIGFEPAWRAGLTRAISDDAAIQVTYSHFQGEDSSFIAASPNDSGIRSLVSHPSTYTNAADNDFLTASGDQHMKYDLGDVDYRWTMAYDCDYSVTLIAGVRYASLYQDFLADFVTTANEEIVHTRTRFDGGGARLGLDAEHKSQHGFLVYAHTAANFVAGTFRSEYTQTSLAATTVNTGFKSDRLVTMLDLELGVGWQGPGNRVRVTAGYLFNGWYNVVKTNDVIAAAQSNDFTGLAGRGSSLFFDGLTTRVEYRF